MSPRQRRRVMRPGGPDPPYPSKSGAGQSTPTPPRALTSAAGERGSFVMWMRIRGLLVIVRAVVPALALIVIATASFVAVGSIGTAAEVYADRVSPELERGKVAIDAAGERLTELVAFASGLGESISATADRMSGLSTEVEIPPDPLTIPRKELIDLPDFGGIDMPGFIPDVPGFTLPTVVFPETTVLDSGVLNFTVPGMAELQAHLAAARVAASSLAPAGDERPAPLAGIATSIESIAAATGDLASEVRSTVTMWLMFVLVLVALVVVAWLATSLPRIIDDVRDGWAMLRGKPASAQTVHQLREQIRTIDARLANLTASAG